MFAVISTEKVSEKKRIRFLKRRKNIAHSVDFKAAEVLKISAVELKLCVWDNISQNELSERMLYAAEILRSFGISRICSGAHNAAENFLCGAGFKTMTEEKLIELKAAEIAARASKSRRNKALFFSGVLTRDRERALTEICSHYRYVAAEIRDFDRVSIYGNMLTRLGISAIRLPENGYVYDVDVAVFLGEPARKIYLPENCPVISAEPIETLTKNVSFRRYVSRAEFELIGRKTDNIPAEYPRNLIISEALRMGKIAAKDILLKNITVKTR